VTKLSHERVLKALVGLGLSEIEAEVYIFLATKGPQKARNIMVALKFCHPQLYRSLKNLGEKGIVSTTLEQPVKFSAIPFDKLLDMLIKTHLKEAQDMEQNREEILSDWYSMIARDSAS
jgi:sugar-specific transcriptional regulator TrmB